MICGARVQTREAARIEASRSGKTRGRIVLARRDAEPGAARPAPRQSSFSSASGRADAARDGALAGGDLVAP